MYAPLGRPLEAGETLSQPGLAAALELVAAQGIGTVYTGTIAELLLAVPGIPVTALDLGRYEARWSKPVGTGYTGTRLLTRGGLAGVSDVLSRLPPLRALSERETWNVRLLSLPRRRPSGSDLA